MRLLTVSNVPLDPSLGSGYVIAGYVEQLRARGHEITTLEPRDYVRWPRLRCARRWRTLAGYTRATLRAVQPGRFEVVELWGAEAWRAVQRLASRAERPLLVGRSNGLEPFAQAELRRHDCAPRPSWAGRLFDRAQQPAAAFRGVDLLTLVSESERNFARAHDYQPAERLLALDNPLPDDWLGLPVPSARPAVLGYFGAWLPHKGTALIPGVLTSALRAHAGWRARLVGPGPHQVQTLFPDDVRARVECLPFVHDKARLRALYQETAVVLLPSVYESFGLVAAEALACGCALVAAPVGFPAALRADTEAVIVRAHTTAAWSAAVTALLGDEARRGRLAAAGHARVQSLRWDHAVTRLENFYARHLPARTAGR